MKDINHLMFMEEEDDSKVSASKNGQSSSKRNGQKVEERLKLYLFNVFCSLLKHFEVSAWKYYVLLIIEFI
jgi:hypothetical protein